MENELKLWRVEKGVLENGGGERGEMVYSVTVYSVSLVAHSSTRETCMEYDGTD